MERTYQQKSEALMQKERNSIERMQREQEVTVLPNADTNQIKIVGRNYPTYC